MILPPHDRRRPPPVADDESLYFFPLQRLKQRIRGRRRREEDTYITVASRLQQRADEEARRRRVQAGQATAADLDLLRRRGDIMPGSPLARLLESPVGRTIAPIAVGVARGALAGVVPVGMPQVYGQEPIRPTRIGELAAFPAEMAGFLIGPAKFLRPASLLFTRRLTEAVGPVVAPRLRNYVRDAIQIGGEGAVYGVLKTLADRRTYETANRIADLDGPIAAAAYVSRRAGTEAVVQAGMWAAFAVPLTGIMGMIRNRSLRARDIKEVVHEAERLGIPERPPGRLPQPEIDFPPVAPPPTRMEHLRLRLPEEEVLIQFREGRWQIKPPEQINRPTPRPQVAEEFTPAVAAAEEAIRRARAEHFVATRTPEEVGRRIVGTRLTKTNLRALGLNPRNIARVAAERNIGLREARQLVLKQIRDEQRLPLVDFLRDERGIAAMDLLAGGFIQTAIGNIRASRALRNPVTIGVAQLMEDPHTRRSFPLWADRMRAKVGELNPDLVPALEPHLRRVYDEARSAYATIAARTVRRQFGPVKRLMQLYHEGEDAHGWYDNIYNHLVGLVGKDDADFLVRALAVLSQGNTLEGNLTMAMKAYMQRLQGRPYAGLSFETAEILRRMDAGLPVQLGRKIDNFIRAMQGDENAVVVDRWIVRAFGLKKDVPTDREYDIIEEWVRQKSRELGVTPRDFQARIWSGIRREYEVADPAASFISTLNARPDHMARVNIILGRLANGELSTPPQWQTADGIRRAAAEERYLILTAQGPIKDHVYPRGLIRSGETPNDALLRELTTKYNLTEQNVIPIKGMWRNADGKVDMEDSFLILGLPLKDGIALGRRYGQSKIVATEGLVDVQRMTMAPRTSSIRFGDEATAGPPGVDEFGYSTISTRQGPLSFAIDYDEVGLVRVREGVLERAFQMLLSDEFGRVRLPRVPGGEPSVIRARWDPNTNTFTLPPHAPAGARAYVEQLSRQYREADLRHIMQRGEPMPAPPEVKLEVDKAGRIVSPNIVQMGEEFATAIKLTNPLSHIRNIVTTSLAGLTRPLAAEAAGLVSLVRTATTGAPRERYMGEGVEQAFGMMTAISDSATHLLRGLRKELRVETARIHEEELLRRAAEAGAGHRFLELFETAGQAGMIPGAFGVRVRTPFRMLALADEAIGEVHRRGGIYQTAYRTGVREGKRGQALSDRIVELVTDPTKPMQEEARKKALEYTFREILGPQATALVLLRDAIPGAKFFVPFMKTLINISKYFLRHSPVGVVTGLRLEGGRIRIREGGEFEDAMGRVIVGSLIGAAATWLVHTGLVTGAGPESRAARQVLYATGWRPHSIRVGDRYISYRGFEPASMVFATAANIVETARTDKEITEMAGTLTADVVQGIADATFVNSLSDLFDAVMDPGRGTRRYMANVIGGAIIPAAVAATARTMDPIVRDPQTLIEHIMVGVPGLSPRVAPRLDVFGRPLRRGGVPLFTPPMSLIEHDPLAAELVRLGVTLPQPARVVRRRGEEIERTPAEIHRLRRERGQMYRERLLKLIGAPAYQRMTDDQKRRILERWIRRIRERQMEEEGRP
jgi:hypothetical protein